MAPAATTEKVTVKNDRGEYYVLCQAGQCEKWRKDKSIAMVDVVEAWRVFVHYHVKGEPESPTKAELEDAFGTHNVDDVIRKILEEGEITKGIGNREKAQDSTRH